jgi:hypothetical protein
LKNSSKIYKLHRCIPLLLLNLLLTLNSTAQHSWLWEKYASSNLFSSFWDIKTDRIGNSYVTGEFVSDTCFYGTTFISGNWNKTNISVVKYSPTGNLIWANSIVAFNNYPMSTALTIDTLGNCYVTGKYGGPIDFDATTTLNDSGMFIAKYDSLGNFSWVIHPGDIADELKSIELDNTGNIFVTGLAIDTTIFDTDTLFQTESFVAKYNSIGTLNWLIPIYGSNTPNSESIHLDLNGNILITGSFSDTIRIGIHYIVDASPSSSDVFLTKLDPSGNILWLKSIAGTNNDRGFAVTSDLSGNIFVTGEISDSVFFANQYYTTNNHTIDIFVAKFDSNGNELWLKLAGGTYSADRGYSIQADILGNCIVRGAYDRNCSFGSNTIYSNGIAGCFISTYNPSGALIELHNFLTSNSNGANSINFHRSFGISSDQFGAIYTVGILDTGLTIFDNDTLQNTDPLPQAIILKLGCETSPSSIFYNGTSLVSTAAIAYQWFLDGLPVNGANSQTLIPNAEGDYQVLVTDSNGCKSTSNIYSYIETSINNSINESVHFVYPNPAKDEIRIAQTNSYHHLQIFDVTGKELHSTKENVIDLSSFSEGFYLYKIWQDNGNCSAGKFVISR